MLDQYHEMMMEGTDGHIKNMRHRVSILREQAKIINAKADVMENEALELEALRIAWEQALKPISGHLQPPIP